MVQEVNTGIYRYIKNLPLPSSAVRTEYPVQVSAHGRSTPYGEQPVCDHLDHLFSPLLSWNLACSSRRGRYLGLTAHSSAYSALPVCAPSSITRRTLYKYSSDMCADNPVDQTKTKKKKHGLVDYQIAAGLLPRHDQAVL